MNEKDLTPTEILIQRLGQMGYVVTNFIPARGYWRQCDVMRWACYAHDTDNKIRHIGSWNTITHCVRRGFRITKGKSDGCEDLEAVLVRPFYREAL